MPQLRRISRCSIYGAALALTLGTAVAQPVSGSVEGGLQELAQAIVESLPRATQM
jgi:hypothetical protein